MMQSCWFISNSGSTQNLQPRGVFELRVLDERPGFLLFEVRGKNHDVFLQEAGAIRWQRIPETEKRGRVHTSTITVAVLRPPKNNCTKIQESNLDIKSCKGSGAGGQHRNTTESAITALHKPTGISVRVESERSQKDNKNTALRILEARLASIELERYNAKRNRTRRNQIGSGMRADKTRTIAEQRDEVLDHKSNKKTTFKKYKKGEFPDLW